MATERLSKLQKWILIQAYKSQDRELKRYDTVLVKNYTISKKEIYQGYFGINRQGLSYKRENIPVSIRVILSRCIKNLIEKELIAVRKDYRKSHIECYHLTERGYNKAKLLNVNKTSGRPSPA